MLTHPNYWLYRAEGVEHFANMKNDPRVRRNRIKTLLAELRSFQRNINEASKNLDVLYKIKAIESEELRSGAVRKYVVSRYLSYAFYSKVDKGEIEGDEALRLLIQNNEAIVNSSNRARWITHTLNRLAFERSMLGEVQRFEGEIRPTLLQMFLREHGADQREARKLDDGLFVVECEAPLPCHIGEGSSLELSADEWRDLMQASGYEPPAKKPAKPPLLNFKAPNGKIKTQNPYRRENDVLVQREMTKAEYAKIHTEQRGTRLSACGEFRVRVCPDPHYDGPRYQAGWAAILITDQKTHPAPEIAA